jgi:LL-diaminopimelate aminotransferase
MQSLKLKNLPPYLFADLDKKRSALIKKGVDIIDLSIGDPDLPTPSHIVKACSRAVTVETGTHRYPPYKGTSELRSAAAGYLKRLRGVNVEPENEVLALVGSKEGIAHAIFALINPGDVVLVPSPGYPVYSNVTLLAGGVPCEMPLKKSNNFLPDFGAIPKASLKKARLMFLNYPNNPTSAVATKEFFAEAVEFAKKNNIMICHDAAYIEVAYDGYKAPSILEVNGAFDCAIEFHSFSKTYNMTGWRLGFAAGNSHAVAALGKFKTHIDSSATAFVQHAGAVALNEDQRCVFDLCAVYKKRRDILCDALEKAGWLLERPRATFYVWAEPPQKKDYVSLLLEKAYIISTPGEGFGSHGKGFIRFSLTSPTDRIEEAAKRIVGI